MTKRTARILGALIVIVGWITSVIFLNRIEPAPISETFLYIIQMLWLVITVLIGLIALGGVIGLIGAIIQDWYDNLPEDKNSSAAQTKEDENDAEKS